MKSYLLIFSFIIIACKQEPISFIDQPAKASCGQCMFNMKGKGCDLAVKIGAEFYYVTGTAIDDYGDAHADDGFCNAIKDVSLSGNLVDGKITISKFKLLNKQL